MSIIHQALKKAEKEKTSPTRPEQLLTIELAHKKTRFNWGPVFVLLVLFLITAPIVAPMFSSPFRDGHPLRMERSQASQPEPMPPFNVVPVTRKAQFNIEEIPLAPLPPVLPRIPDLNLSGIVYSSPSEAYCIINDRIAKPGDTVQGAVVVNVAADQVTLDYQGQQVLLSLAP